MELIKLMHKPEPEITRASDLIQTLQRAMLQHGDLIILKEKYTFSISVIDSIALITDVLLEGEKYPIEKAFMLRGKRLTKEELNHD